MKQKKLAPLLAVIMSVEMIIAPVIAHGSDTQAPKKQQGSSESSTAEIFSTVLQFGQGLVSQLNQNQMSPQLMSDMGTLQQQQTPQTDKYFNPQRLSQIPGLTQYMAMNNINPQMLDCKTLPTTMHELKNEVCRIGVTSDTNIPPSVQLQEMNIYHNQYTQINKVYRNYSAESNVEGQPFGVGCMKNAMQILSGFFQYRMNELDKLTTNLEAMNNQFREASRADLDAIEESTAVLEGGDSDLANKVKTNNPDLFDFGKRFNNPACTAMMTSDKFNDLGRDRGLNEINRTLKKTLTTPSGKFSGESYSTSHANVVDSINKLADKVGKQMELNFTTLSGSNKGYSDVINGMKGLSSSHGLNGAISPDMFSDLQTKFIEKNDKMKSDMADVASELGPIGAQALDMVRNPNSGALNSELATIETRIKNGCLQNSVNLDSVLEKVYDPTASKFANENASNFLKDKLKQIMENDRTSLEKKMAELKAIESQQGSRYYLKMENSYEVQEVDSNGKLTTRIVGASTRRTPSMYFSDVIKNCEAQYKVNHLGNKMSGAAAVQKLRNLHQEYKSMAKTHALDAREAIKKKMIQCDNSLDANNQVVGSCTPGLFNTSAPGFCANAALSCAKNMQECTKQAETFVKDIKTERTARVKNYKALVQKNKQDIVKIFDTALSSYMREGEMMRGLFGVGFSSPKGIEREVPEGARYLDSFQSATSGSPDGTLLLEDPDKYVAMFKKNIDLLKESVKQQQDQIMGSGSGRSAGGLLAEHIRNTEKNYKEVIRDSERFAQNCIQQHDQFVKSNETQKNKMREEQQKEMSELGEQLPLFCRKFETAQESVIDACNGNTSELVKAAMKAAHRSGNTSDLDAVSEYSNMCDSYGNTSSDDSKDVLTKCTRMEKAEFKYKKQANDACTALLTIMDEKDTETLCMVPRTVGYRKDSDEEEEGRSGNLVKDCNKAMKNKEEAIERFYSFYKSNGGSGDASGGITTAAPSFCSAGNNSDRSVAGKLSQHLNQTLEVLTNGAVKN